MRYSEDDTIKFLKENSIYNDMPKRQKTDITQTINQYCRDYLVGNNWDNGAGAALNVFKEIIDSNRYIRNLVDPNVDTNGNLKALIGYQISESLNSFSNQSPTASQVYRYVDACLAVGITPKKIWKNSEIWIEISRLENMCLVNN